MAEDGEEEPANQADVPRVTNLLDQAELKRVLDECASQIVIEAGFPESMFISNVKIGLGALTCATALLAQFHPMPFPRNYPLLLVCVLVYFVLNTALQAFTYMRERDIILSTHGRTARVCDLSASHAGPDGLLQGAKSAVGLALSSSMPRYSDLYTLSLRPRDAPPSTKAVELCKSVTSWIYEDGEVDQAALKADVLRLVNTFEGRGGGGRTKAE